jgi:DNA adenine methylase
MQKKVEVVPFLRWAGGKRWLVKRYSHLLPTKFDRYVEPFLGSGAVFFYLQPYSAILSDLNPELIETYLAIKQDWKQVYKSLIIHENKHCKEYYYKVRSTYYNLLTARAARFIYLNRTCWNGLYRVNLKGIFNVPLGTKQNVLLSTDDFETVASILQGVDIVESDFKKIIDNTNSGDFLFVDPPYTIQHENNGFVKYNERLFKWEDQIRLHDCLLKATQRGVKVILTNASHSSILKLYENDFSITPVLRYSIIAGLSSSRKVSEELIIMG